MKQSKQNILLLKVALKEGDQKAFKTIFETHLKNLTAFVNGFTNNKALTEDIVQDTFIKLWNARESFDIDHSIIGFLYKTAHNTFIDKYRKKKREKAMLDSLAYKRLMEIVDEDETVKLEKIKKIKTAIENLPPRCQEIFKLSKFEGLKYAEIAERLHISKKTVEVQMGKAFTKIRNEVNGKNTFQLFLSFFAKKSVKIDYNLLSMCNFKIKN